MGLVTTTTLFPNDESTEVVTCAVSCVGLMKLVTRSTPPIDTTPPCWKFCPFTVSVKGPPNNGARSWLTSLIAGLVSMILNPGLILSPSPGDEAPRAYPCAGLSKDKSSKVATPPMAGWVVIPERVALPGLNRMKRLTLCALDVRLPNRSSIRTVTGGFMMRPASVFDGGWPYVNRTGGAGAMLKVALMVGVSSGDEPSSVYPPAALSSERSVNVATPATSRFVLVPLRAPPPGLFPMTTLTVAVLAVACPSWSSIRTVTRGAMLWPAIVFDGCCPNTNLTGGPQGVVMWRTMLPTLPAPKPRTRI